MPTTPGPRVVARASAWDHPASGGTAVRAFIASHAFNSSLTFVVPEVAGGRGSGGAAVDPPPPPPPFYAVRASPAALASPEFAAWAFPDTYGVLPEEEEEEGGAAGGGEAMAVDGPPPPPPPPPRPPARGAAALATPGSLDSAGSAALLPRGSLLLTVPASTFQRLGLPGARLRAAERGGRAGALAKPRTAAGGGGGGGGGGRRPPPPPPSSPTSAAAWYAVHIPLTGTRRSSTPGGPRAKAADRLAGTAGVLDWCLLAPPPPPPPPAGQPGPAASPFSTGPPPPHIPGLSRVTPVQPARTAAVLRQAGPPDWEGLFFGRGAGNGGDGGAPASTPDGPAAVAALDWVGAVAAAAAGLDPTAAALACGGGGRGGGGPPPPPPTTSVHATAWSGFFPSAWAAAAVDAARAAVEAGVVPWAAVAVAGFPHAPEAWAPKAGQESGGGGGGGPPANPVTPGVRAGSRGRASGWVFVALPGGRYGLLAASAGPDGLRSV